MATGFMISLMTHKLKISRLHRQPTLAIVAHVDLGGLRHGAGGGEARGQPHVLQDEVGGPLHGVVGGARAGGEVVADAVGRDGEQGQRERLRRGDVRDAHQRREV